MNGICERHWARGIENRTWSIPLQSRRIMVAINLKDSAKVIPSMQVQLLRLARMLDNPGNLFVSVYESGSRDATPDMLKDMAAAFRFIFLSYC